MREVVGEQSQFLAFPLVSVVARGSHPYVQMLNGLLQEALFACVFDGWTKGSRGQNSFVVFARKSRRVQYVTAK